jgi:DNA-binding beta-propeller fold protein YncE
MEPCSSAGLQFLAPLVFDDHIHPGMQLALVDLTNGLPSCGFDPVPIDNNNRLAVSPDGQHLAVVTSSRDDFSSARLLQVDLTNGKVFDSSAVVDNWISDMAFNPDGSHLALAYSQLHSDVIDPKATRYTLLVTGFGDDSKSIETTLPFSPRLLRFTPDGSAIVAYGNLDGVVDGPFTAASTALLDATDLSILWEQELGQVKNGYVLSEGMVGGERLMKYLEPAAVYSTQKNLLYIVHADQDKLTLVDFASRQVRTLDIHPKLSSIERLLSLFAEPAQAKAASGTRKQAVLSPDGQRLYVAASRDDVKIDKNGSFTPIHEASGLQVLDPNTGEELHRLQDSADEIRISPDGAWLFLTSWQRQDQNAGADVISTKDFSIHAHFDDRRFVITISPLGKPHALLLQEGAWENQLVLLDWDSLQPGRSWKVTGYPYLANMP